MTGSAGPPVWVVVVEGTFVVQGLKGAGGGASWVRRKEVMRGVALRLLWLLEGPSFFSSADGLLNSAVAVSLAVRRWCIMDGNMLQRRYRIGHMYL